MLTKGQAICSSVKAQTDGYDIDTQVIVDSHLCTRETKDRIETSFNWPGISSNVLRLCRSCNVCQKVILHGMVSKVPLGEMPVIETLFYRPDVDLLYHMEAASRNIYTTNNRL